MAGALNFIGRDTLFGRYWGCIEHHPCLHFELCYYQAIDFAIAHGLRGSRRARRASTSWRAATCRSTTHSLHWIADPGFRDAVARYLAGRARAVDEEIEVLTSYGPFRRMQIEEQE